MPFATAADVQTRIGRTLTVAEEATAEQVIETVTGLIADAVDRDSAWAAALDPVPAVVRGLCIEKAVGALANPLNLAAESKTLGSYSSARTFPRVQDVGVFLTPVEERIAINAIYGSSSGSGPTESVMDDLLDLAEGRDVGEDPE